MDNNNKTKKTFNVTIVRYGFITVNAENEKDALYLADHQTTDSVSWSDDWTPTDATETDYDEDAISEKAFE